MLRVQELIDDVRSLYPRDQFFADFEESCKINPDKRRHYRTYDDAFRVLDDQSWDVLKQKSLDHFVDHRDGQLKQGFFNQLNEVFAYRYLVNQKYNRITILPETGNPNPDLRYYDGRKARYCEVKTICLSDDEIQRRRSVKAYDGGIYERLSPEFLKKFQSTIEKANNQLLAKGDDGIIYLILRYDDLALDYYQTYRKQIRQLCSKNRICNLYIKIGIRGRKRIRITNAQTA